MNVLEEQSLQSRDDLDQLLRGYFQAEMPDPWPRLEAPAAAPRIVPARPARATGRGMLRSRLALAASIALLIIGLVFLGGKMREAPAGIPGTYNEGAADHRDPRGPLEKHAPRSRSREGLIQKPDATYIQIDIFELPSSK